MHPPNAYPPHLHALPLRSQVQHQINNSWVPVNMQKLQGDGYEESGGQRARMMCWCEMSRAGCKIRMSREGWVTEPLNWCIMALKNTDGIICVGYTSGKGKQGGTNTGGETDKRKGTASDHTRIIRFYRLTRLKSWFCLLSSEMPGGVWFYV